MKPHALGIRREIERLDKLIAAFIKIENDFKNETYRNIIAQLQTERANVVGKIGRSK